MGQKLGQNFLIDKTIARDIVDSLGLTRDDTVLEIGPGRGVLTELIAPRVKKLIAVDIDGYLASRLKAKFAGSAHVEVIHGNFLDLDLASFDFKYKILGNLPYYIATVIINRFLPEKNWETASIMVQKEVAERIVSQKDRSSYGVLSITCQHYARAELLFSCGPEAFNPQPKIDSSVIRFTNRHEPALSPKFVKVINAAFGQKRKTILNSISNCLGIPKPETLKILSKAGIAPGLRGENLSIRDLQNLTNSLDI